MGSSILLRHEDGATEMTHDQRWRDGWLLFAAVATGFGLLMWPWTGVALYLAVATLGSATVLLVRHPPPRSREGSSAAPPYPWGALAARSARIGLCVTGLAVTSATVTALAVVVVVLVVLTSPLMRRTVRGDAPPADDLIPDEPRLPLPRRPSQANPPMPTSVLGMTDDELCLAWRRSYITVTLAGSTAKKRAMVALRAAYLDEIERRDPQAFHAWLASGASASGSPHCYLDEEPPPRGRTDAA
jgi:hypothetical protein